MRRRSVPAFRPPFRIPLLIFFWFGVMQAFNPGSTSIWFGPLGLKIYFLYVPLMMVGYAQNSEAELRRFFTLNMALIVTIVSLGIAQAILGPSFLNPATLGADIEAGSTLYRVSPLSGTLIYRPCGVFVSNGRYSDFLLVGWLLVLGFSGYLLLRQRKGRWLAFVALAVTTAGVFMAGSRCFGAGLITGHISRVHVGSTFGAREKDQSAQNLAAVGYWRVLAVALLF